MWLKPVIQEVPVLRRLLVLQVEDQRYDIVGQIIILSIISFYCNTMLAWYMLYSVVTVSETDAET